MAQFSAFHLTSSLEYPYLVSVDALLHESRPSWSTIYLTGCWKDASIPQQSQVRSTLWWDHFRLEMWYQLQWTKNPLWRGNIFFYFNSAVPPSNGACYHRKMQCWSRDLDFTVKKWVSEHKVRILDNHFGRAMLSITNTVTNITAYRIIYAQHQTHHDRWGFLYTLTC